eukprot:CAMPEP_0114511814 /NCGR_PEP_ID=MMETSP0109-20121206/14618_1 /TAXON_ID=29199 /ORGANISM="Chlorarachnion reptans, Strain CCCM449" /LENGTH=854 /DNA_ID=CAMNT_0001691407 /DNA_START=35 /DNA_END=2600 /DNA_ORIENTATION=-
MASDFILTLEPLPDDEAEKDDDEEDFEMAKPLAKVKSKGKAGKKNKKKKDKKKKKKKKKKGKEETADEEDGEDEEEEEEEEEDEDHQDSQDFRAFADFAAESLGGSGGDKGAEHKIVRGDEGLAQNLRHQSVVEKIQRRLLAKDTFEKARRKREGLEDEPGDDDDGDSEEDDSEDEDDDDDDDDEVDDGGKKTKAKGEGETSAKELGRKNVVTVDFSQLKLSRPLLKAIREMEFVRPTPVQANAIPPGLLGKDLLVCAQTGSGKTAAFMLPVLERLLYRPRRVPLTRVLVVTPTRELAQQIIENGRKLAAYARGVTFCLVVGGLSLNVQAASLRARPDVVVATPGRLIDHLRNTLAFDLDALEVLILDEADRLLDLGFKDEIEEMLRLCPRGRQTMLFSATLAEGVSDLVDLSLNEPVRIAVDRISVVDTLAQEFVRIRPSHENQGTREAIVLALCARSFKNHRIVPSIEEARTQGDDHFGLAGIKAAELHGQLTQQQRLDALALFHAGKVDVLLATDLAARGLDIKGVTIVVNYNMPRQLSRYIHRVGRTARAGNKGVSVTLVGESGRKNLKEVVKMAKDATRSRQVPPKVIEKYKKKISSYEEDIRAVLEMEHEEKMIRKAEMQANKGINIITYEDEIKARPARTWFQTEKQKQAIKMLSKSNDLCEDVQRKEKKEESEEDERRELIKGKKKKDPFLGLSRAKKRRKLRIMEEEKSRKAYEKEIKSIGGTTKKKPEQRMLAAAHKAKAARRPDRNALDQKEDIGGRTLKKLYGSGNKDGDAEDGLRRNRQKIRQNRYKAQGQLDEDGADTFARRYRDEINKPANNLKEKKKIHARGKSKKAFKSKGRYKRRK